MQSSDPFVIDGDIAIWRPRATLSLERVIELVRTGIDSARARGMRRLLIDLTALDGFASPSIPARHQFARAWAEAAGGALRIAFLAKPEMIDPQKFGVMVGRNFGADANVFASEADALEWLRRD